MIKLLIILMLSLPAFSLVITEDMRWKEYEHSAYQYLPPMGSEKVVNKVEVKTNPIVRDQDGFGTCYLFAMTSLMDQSCLKSGNCTKDDQISVLDVLGKTQLKSGDQSEFLGLNGGNLSQVIDALTKGEKVSLKFAKEECAPYQQIENYNNPDNDFRIVNYPQLLAINEIYHQVKDSSLKDGVCNKCTEDFFKDFFPFSSSMLESLSRAATKITSINAFEEFLNEVLIPKKCQEDKSQIKLAPIGFKQERISDVEKFRNKMTELFEKDKSAAISSCTWTRYCNDPSIKYMEMCPKEQRKRYCGGHAYLLSGFRKICDDKNKCRNQYRVHNSWGKNFEVFNDNGWVNEDSLFKAYLDLGNQLVTYTED
ncbi:hypothetical protein M902_1010 [Bacteriovorax sp. BAL6_X]|uniref:hypothetical protein n=1 Tax=Bacteriovorax sp. BAL6_X TaxID=1201290 RepID=UPI000385E053|nr:hypothetical protein [Bacteriovorax sp. BAL6_X]EPZ50125.1 hypothetical protein M902_1010 [Bacteriovorax sp. BAL6_X]